MTPEFVIARNFPWCDEHDDASFTGRLHEEALWDADEYWQLEWALYRLAGAKRVSHDTLWRIFHIFSNTSMSFGCHFDRNDVWKIGNLKRREIYDYRERFQLIFEGFFSGEMPGKDDFDLKNPLLSA